MGATTSGKLQPLLCKAALLKAGNTGRSMIQKQYGDSEVRIFPSKDALVEATVECIARALREAITSRKQAYVAISGGSTPKPVYERLRTLKGIDYRFVHVCFVDERNVPPTDDQSNFRMANLAWFDSGVVPATNILRMQGELDANVAAEKYETELRKLNMPLKDGFPVFDLILLGMGTDGHCASLFPGSPALTENKRWVVGNWVPELNTHRITITYPVLNHAREAVFMVSEASKAKPLSEVLSGKGDLPSAKVHPVDGKLIWLVDEAAAALLP